MTELTTGLPIYTGEEWLEGLEWGINPTEVAENYEILPTTTDWEIREIATAEYLAWASECIIDLDSFVAELRKVRDGLR